MVDIISNGRFDWGIGKGYDHLEFQSYGVPFEEREERWEEAIDIVLRAWTDGHICYEGKHWNIPETELFPKPVQKPRPPAYLMVSRSDSSAIYAAEHLYPMVLGQGPDWDDARHKLELYRETALKAGHAPAAVDDALTKVYQMKQVHVAPTREQAAKEYEAGLMWYFDVRRNREMYGFGGDPQPYSFYLDHPSVILGTPEEVGERIEAYRKHTGINNLICWFNCGAQPRDQVRTSMELFSREVMPRFK
jgi:alkanesulfonate monooxygenase SsuD/methylene tetrahydromethanopterin reductase-like flavin-dependent oxidoreductase (luciferase family)